MVLSLTVTKIFNKNLVMNRCLSFWKLKDECLWFYYILDGSKSFGFIKVIKLSVFILNT